MEIFKLFGSIFVDNDKANESISKTEKKAESLGSKLGDGIKNAGKWGLAIGAGAAAAGASLLGMASQAANTTDEIDKMSQKIGISREGYQEWGYILSQNGMDVNSLQSGLKTLTNQFDDLSKGGTKATEAFGELGLGYEDLEGKSQEEIFEITIQALQGMEDTTKRAAIANDLLGKSGSELAPLLNQTAESTEVLKNKAHDLGLVMGDDAIDAGVKFSDTMDDLKRSFGAAATQVGVTLMPIIQSFLDWVIAHMPEIQAFMQTAFDVISKAVSILYEWFSAYFYPILKDVFDWVVANWPMISAVFKVVFDAIGVVVNEAANIIQTLFGWLKTAYSYINGTFRGIRNIFENIFGGINNVIQGTIGWIQDLIGWASDAIDKVKSIGSGVSSKASDAVSWISSKINGSHADGLNYVPYDGYIAELHKGERILTKQEAESYSRGGGIVVNMYNTVRNEADIQKISYELNKEINKYGRAIGVSI